MTDPMREFARRLFSREQPDDPPRMPAPGEVRSEGRYTPPPRTDDRAFRDYVGDLFGTDLNARGLNTTPHDS